MNTKQILMLTASLLFFVAVSVWVFFSLRSEDSFLVSMPSNSQVLDNKEYIVNAHTIFFITGVIHSESLSELNEARVCAFGIGSVNRTDRHCVNTDSQGNYELELSFGAYSLVASAKHHANVSQTISYFDEVIERVDFNLPIAEPTIGGIIKSAYGQPVNNAKVTVLTWDKQFSRVLSNHQGKFLAWAKPGMVRLQVEAEGFASKEVSLVAPTLDADITLFPGYEIQGQVLSRKDNKPVTDVRVVAVQEQVSSVSEDHNLAANTDTNGEFNLRGLSAGSYRVLVRDKQWVSEKSESILLDAEHLTGETQLFAMHGVTITGRLKLTTGGTCHSGRVAFQADQGHMSGPQTFSGKLPWIETASTDKFGTVTLPALMPGYYRIYADCDGHIFDAGPEEIRVTGNDNATPLEWRFSSAGSLQIHLTDSANQFVDGAFVSASALSNREQGEAVPMQKLAGPPTDGYYRIDGLQPGTYLVQAQLSGIYDTKPITKTVNLSAERKLETVELKVDQGGTIDVSIRSPAGNPINQLLVFAEDRQANRYDALVLGGGQFRLAPLPQENYRVYAYDNKNPKIPINHSGEEVIGLDRNQHLSLQLTYQPPNGAISGILYDTSGSPMQNIAIRAVSNQLSAKDEQFAHILDDNAGDRRSLSNQQGDFIISGLTADAEYDLYFETPTGLTFKESNIRTGQRLTLYIPGAATLSGLVTLSSDNENASEFFIELKDLNNQQHAIQNVIRSSDGSFSLSNLTPGRKSIALYSGPNCLSLKQTVQIKEGENHFGFELPSECL